MKLFALTIFALLSMTSLAQAESVTIKVKGMICDSCAESVTNKLKGDPAVESVAVEVKKGFVEVAFKDGASVKDETLKTLIADAGYTALEIVRKH